MSPDVLEAERLFAAHHRDSPEELAILRADLEAARWCEGQAGDQIGPAALAEFVAMHHRQTARIRGTRVDFAHKASAAHMQSVVGRWVGLYRRALAHLRARYPASTGARLTLAGEPWSEALGINAAGLASLSTASRYAEFWAEQSLTNAEIERSYPERLSFLSTDIYDRLFALAAQGELLIYDTKGLALSLYDVAISCRQLQPGEELVTALLRRGLAISELSTRAQQYLDELREARAPAAVAVAVACHRLRGAQLLAQLGPDPLLHAAPRRQCSAHPLEWAWATFARGAPAITGHAITHVDADRRRSWVSASTSADAFALFRALHALAEFQTVSFDPLFRDEARSVFPNLRLEESVLFPVAPSQLPPSRGAEPRASLRLSADVEAPGPDRYHGCVGERWTAEDDAGARARCVIASLELQLDWVTELELGEEAPGRALLEHLAGRALAAGRRLVLQVREADAAGLRLASQLGLSPARRLAAMDYEHTSWHALRRSRRAARSTA